MGELVDIHVVYAFEHKGAGGNPAGVVLDAHKFSVAQKQAIAAAAGLSETAFVSSSQVAAFKLEFFTPTRQIAHCGHATIATFSYLRQLGRVKEGASSKETIDGVREILLESDAAFMQQQAPKYFVPHEESNPVSTARIARSLGLAPAGLHQEHPPVICTTGNRFLLVGLANGRQMASIRADFGAISAISEALDLIGYYVWVPATIPFHANARMFAPRYGIPEEAGTGMAAGPLACYLSERYRMSGEIFAIQQGAYMTPPSPSRIEARLTSGRSGVQALLVGGRARYGSLLRVDVSDST